MKTIVLLSLIIFLTSSRVSAKDLLSDGEFAKIDNSSELALYLNCIRELRKYNTADEAETGFFEGTWGSYIVFTSVQDKKEGIVIITNDSRKEGEVEQYFAPYPGPIESYFKNERSPKAFLEVNYSGSKSLYVHYSREQQGIVNANTFPPTAYTHYHKGFVGAPADTRYSTLFFMHKMKRMISNVAKMYASIKKNNENTLFKIDLHQDLRKKIKALNVCDEIPSRVIHETIETERMRFESFDEYNKLMKDEALLEAKLHPCKKNCGKKDISK